ncbi:MAG: hypothetical protein R2867_23850 [Caldilineaceae bacterium]
MGPGCCRCCARAADRRLDLLVTVLGAGLSDYRRSVQHWWGKVQEALPVPISRRPIYFVSSNAHSMINLISGFAWEQQKAVTDYVLRHNPENLRDELLRLQESNTHVENGHLRNFLYYTMRHLDSIETKTALNEREQLVGVTRISDPHCLDVEAQILEINKLDVAHMDPRLHCLEEHEWTLLRQSDALIFNIDYPLGMAAYHIFSQVSTAVGRILGIYILGSRHAQWTRWR